MYLKKINQLKAELSYLNKAFEGNSSRWDAAGWEIEELMAEMWAGNGGSGGNGGNGRNGRKRRNR